MPQAPQLNQGIKVFYSYSHKDERIRNELANHLSILRRQGVISEWHDRKIGAGSEWAGEIDQHLNTAQVILLLISPDFLASDYCYDIEMKRAMERHDAGEACVIPVILRPVVWMGAPFDKLQALPKDAKAVVSWRSWDEAFVSVAEGIRKAVEDLKRPSIPDFSQAQQVAVKETFRTLVVDQMHRGDYVTITEAIALANPGDRILVRPDFYQESLVIDKPLEIIGDGEPGEVVIQVLGNHVISFKATRGRVTNLTLQQIGGAGDWHGVDIAQGRLDLDDCDITSQSAACVGIHDGAAPRLRRNRIHDCKQAGVFIYDNGQGMLEDNEIFGNGYAGIEIKTGSNPIVRRNRIYGGKQSGIYIYKNGLGLLEENQIFGNAFSGIRITTGGNPTIRRNRIHDCKQAGIFIHDNGQGILEGNDIFANAFSGLWVMTGGTPIVRYNRINKNKQAMWISEGGGGTFEDNDLRGNTHGAWSISLYSLPNVKRARNIEE